ncbi:single-stranded-DNA-specific exonuclease RecJ [Robiginitomaculum antarcticum]|uniref:single-stranded-DNA-specific exonuclease RecJ n=1 Tax=Robiginitomaculum antarcticum TaxID=437507 RepID=UPI00037A0F47|nr:single-stranded-DNA-specific exonuclease RecJ [Robiginitomaculum antarcticum]
MAGAARFEACLGVENSAAGKRWRLRPADEQHIKDLQQRAGLSDFTARLLASRGITAGEAGNFLSPTLKRGLPDPSSFADMDKAAGLILDALAAGQSVTVFADYDVDGGSSAAQLIRWSRDMGYSMGLYVPDRVTEGYGPSAKALLALKDEGVDLVITVDCGAAAYDALTAAHEAGLPVIVIDHHLMAAGEMPPCAALVNPNRADDKSGQGHMAAAGVTFMMLVALSREARRRGTNDVPDLRRFLGMTAMGTICDVVPLTGVNRVITAQGLKVLTQRVNPGIAALCDVAELSMEGGFTPYHAGFIVGPRINAGGRIGQADMGAKLLATDDPDEARSYARQLDVVNRERRRMQDMMHVEALQMAEALPDDAPMIIVAREGWHPGLIGIVAGRLKDRFDRPALVIGIDGEGMGKGSGRSMSGVNLGAAISVAKDAGLLVSGGGHAMAGGLSVKANKIKDLTEFLNSYLSDDITAARAQSGRNIDAIITLGAAGPELINEIDAVGPFGMGNPQPVFAFENVRVAYSKRLNGGHVRVTFEDAGGGRLSGICFRAEEQGFDTLLLSPESKLLHIAGRLKRDSWKGRERIDLQLVDIAPAR